FLHNPHPVMKLTLILVGLILVVAGGLLLWVSFSPTPDLASFADRKVVQSTKIYDRTGNTVLYDLSQNVEREVVPLSDISPEIRNATIAIEDANFYQHGGIRITSIIRAALADIFGGALAQGGSTITQQVVKNTLLTDQKSITRKVHEWVLAVKLEQKYSKDQILETYLNEMPYGGTIYGVQAASQAFFGKDAKDVDTAEAAYLAAVLQAPTYYSPYGSHRDALEARKNLVLSRMKDLGFITDAEYQAASTEQVTFLPQHSNAILAPHFVFYIREYLEQKYGSLALEERGLKVITTLDLGLEEEAEQVIKDNAARVEKSYNASNSALVAIDPKTGQILAMVGSRDYFDPTIDGNYNAATALRQPGSTFKPIVYAAALMKGYTPDTTVFDLPTQFSTACKPTDNASSTAPCYSPVNFDDKFRGPMTFTTALAQSINVPAVKVLYLVGIQSAINLARSFGLTTLTGDPSKYGLTLVLGGGDVRLLDMTDAYGVFADDGVLNPSTGILRIEDAGGNVLEQYQPQPSQVIPAPIARSISSMLSNNDARAGEFGTNSPLNFPGYDVAVKTGTTNDFRDAWTIGYTPSVVIGMWAGNNDNSPMAKNIAGYIVAPVWNQVMQYALSHYPKEYFGQPPTIPSDAKPVLRGIWNVPPQADGTGGVHSLLYWTDPNDPAGPPPKNPASDPQYAYWEYPIQQWLLTHPSAQATTSPI
ncbi:MAG: PBP1A family penicillin-binding protein, partial [Patescibacteria group bacterium]|nr:PBP1A family penicillin-binding protein [Patescibacteria group bacterium]